MSSSHTSTSGRQGGTLAVERLPAFRRLEALLRHAEGLEVVKEVKPQIEAIMAHRRLLDASDPVPGLGRTLVDALRTALVEAESLHHQAYETEWQRLEGTESWRTIEQENRDAILARLRIEKTNKGAIGTEQEVPAIRRPNLARRLANSNRRTPAMVRGRPRRSRPSGRAEDPPPEAGDDYPSHPGGRENVDQADRATPLGGGRARSHRDRLTEEDEPCSSTASG